MLSVERMLKARE